MRIYKAIYKDRDGQDTLKTAFLADQQIAPRGFEPLLPGWKPGVLGLPRRWGQPDLLHADCFLRAGVNANSAINAGFFIDNGLIFGHFDSFAWTLCYTGFTTSAFLFIYFSWHLRNPFKKNRAYNCFSKTSVTNKTRNLTKLLQYYNLFFEEIL